MERKNFGKLVAALRKENFDPTTGKAWSQEMLAESANLSPRAIQRIEQGELAHIDEQTLLQLVRALQLTTIERRELCFAATAISDADIAYPVDPSEAFQEVWAILQSLRLPAILYNQFYDVIGINSIMMAFYGISRKMLPTDEKESSHSNFLRFLFAPQSPLRTFLKNQWRAFVQHNLLHFRHTSLRYRYTDYYQALFNDLNQNRDFRDAWAATKGVEETKFTQLKSYEYEHPLLGGMQYIVLNTTVLTQTGNLNLSTLAPCDNETQQAISQLIEAESPYTLPLTSWPIQS